VLRLRSVTKRYESTAETIVAVAAASLTVHAGEVVGLAGPSGSGKTTLLNLVIGWDRPDDGVVERRDDVTVGWSGLAVVPQELGLLPELTVRQNVELARRLARNPRGRALDAVDDLLAELGLAELSHRRPGELSLGEQQRTAVARAVACAPTLIVADEPTAHQDEVRSDMVTGVLARAAARGGAVLIATHDDRVLAHVTRVVRILDGCVTDG
jgi:putative ABC transport system ATP-binding protein